MEIAKLRAVWITLLCGLVYSASPAAEDSEGEDFTTDTISSEQRPPSSAPAEKATAKEPPASNLFRVPGADAIVVARAAGYCFSPNSGKGPRDGIHTVAMQYGNLVTSEVDGVKMIQYRPPGGWSVATISNTFYMFVDARLRPAPLAPGWMIRGIKLSGPSWQWHGHPAPGAPSASFAITIFGHKLAAGPTTVELTSIILQGPPGATDWRAAFAAQPKPRAR